MIGSTNLSKSGSFMKRLNFVKSQGTNTTDAEIIVKACTKMGSSKTGALIVIERNNNLDFLVETGDNMKIAVTQPILESIFFKNSPLHDGAIIISNNVIKATRVILPVNNEKNIPSRFGLRHRAAVGITEKTDAVALVVSEETGQVSYVNGGTFVMYSDTQDLIEKIKSDLN
jgi:diadenylate cyclase